MLSYLLVNSAEFLHESVSVIDLLVSKVISSFISFDSPFVSLQLLVLRIRLLPLWIVQPMRLWFRGVASPELTRTPPPLWMKNKDFSAAAPLTLAAAYPTWNVASSTLSLYVTMTGCAPACLLSPYICNLVGTSLLLSEYGFLYWNPKPVKKLHFAGTAFISKYY